MFPIFVGHIISIFSILKSYSSQVLTWFYWKNNDDNFTLVVSTYPKHNLGIRESLHE